jgi:hypothetical protein
MSTAASNSPVGIARFAAVVSDPTALQFIDATLEVLVTRLSLVGRGGPIAADVWGVPGVYVLLGLPSALPPQAGPIVRARPGRTGDLLQRMRQHAADTKLAWARRALLVRGTGRGFNTAHTGYLEGRLHDLCAAATPVEHVGRSDDDQTLPDWERDELDRRYLPHIRAVLELVGVPTDPIT